MVPTPSSEKSSSTSTPRIFPSSRCTRGIPARQASAAWSSSSRWVTFPASSATSDSRMAAMGRPSRDGTLWSLSRAMYLEAPRLKAIWTDSGSKEPERPEATTGIWWRPRISRTLSRTSWPPFNGASTRAERISQTRVCSYSAEASAPSTIRTGLTPISCSTSRSSKASTNSLESTRGRSTCTAKILSLKYGTYSSTERTLADLLSGSVAKADRKLGAGGERGSIRFSPACK